MYYLHQPLRGPSGPTCHSSAASQQNVYMCSWEALGADTFGNSKQRGEAETTAEP